MKVDEIHIGQVLRIDLKDNILDKTGFVSSKSNDSVTVTITAGPNLNRAINVKLENIESVVEICSSPLFHRLKRLVDGEKAKNGDISNLHWEKDENSKGRGVDDFPRPKMHLSTPDSTKYRRVWHLFKLFPKVEFEYCSNVALKQKYGDSFTKMDTVAFFGS